jgi:hypothetical protein
MNAAEKVYELVKGMPEEEVNQVLSFIESLQQKTQHRVKQNSTLDSTPKQTAPARGLLLDYAGILKDSPNFNEDPIELQRRMRDEWS